MLGTARLFGGIGVGVVGGTTMARCDDDAPIGPLLQEVEELKKDGINSLSSGQDGKPVLSITIEERGLGIEERRVERTAPTPEKLAGDAWQMGFGLPGIGRARHVIGRLDDVTHVLRRPLNPLCEGV